VKQHPENYGILPYASCYVQTVVHSEEFVTDEGVHSNQVECLWSLVNPWLQTFRDLPQARIAAVRPKLRVRTDAKSVGAPVHSLLDCFVVNVSR